MAPNYAAGKNMVAGVTRTFKGKIVGKDLTKWGKDAQLDFSAELAKAKASGAEGIFVFYPGKAGGAFIKQYAQAGLQGKIPLLCLHRRLDCLAKTSESQNERRYGVSDDTILGTRFGYTTEQKVCLWF